MTPNFFVVGAPKAGTTSLYHYLQQHPVIYLSPIKEPCFFAPEVVDFTPASREHYELDRESLREYLNGPLDQQRSGIVLDWQQYLQLFKNVTHQTAIGEVSGSYLASSTAPAAIRERIPHARLIVMLRNPVDRVYSQYVAALSLGLTRAKFADWVQQQVHEEERLQPRFGVVWTGKYATHLQRYLAHFPASQISVHFYEDYTSDPKRVLGNMFSFLGVDRDWPIDTSIRHNVTLAPRLPRLHATVVTRLRLLLRVLPRAFASRVREWYRTKPASCPPSERAAVLQVYQDDIRALEELTGRDLSCWRRIDM